MDQHLLHLLVTQGLESQPKCTIVGIVSVMLCEVMVISKGGMNRANTCTPLGDILQGWVRR